MASAARVHALERGKDPRRFPLFAFGGAGPVQAHRLALALGSPYWIAPLGAGVISTVGFLSAPLAFDFVRSWPGLLETICWATANRLLDDMEQDGRDLLTQSDVPESQVRHRREVDMRFVGQGHLIQVALPEGALNQQSAEALARAFRRVYRQLYERPGPPVAIEIVNWRVTSSGPRPDVRLDHAEATAGGSAGPAQKASRRAFFPEADGFVDTPVLDRYRLPPGASFQGPAIVEERESTAIVGPGATCRIDDEYNLIVQPASRGDGETEHSS